MEHQKQHLACLSGQIHALSQSSGSTCAGVLPPRVEIGTNTDFGSCAGVLLPQAECDTDTVDVSCYGVLPPQAPEFDVVTNTMLIMETIRGVFPEVLAPFASKILEKCSSRIDGRLSDVVQQAGPSSKLSGTVPQPSLVETSVVDRIHTSSQTLPVQTVDVPPKRGPSPVAVSHLCPGCYVQLFCLSRTELNGQIGFIIEQLPEQLLEYSWPRLIAILASTRANSGCYRTTR